MTDKPAGYYLHFDYQFFKEDGSPMDISEVPPDEIAEVVRGMYTVMLLDREPRERVH